jgi:hypothetical protein
MDLHLHKVRITRTVSAKAQCHRAGEPAVADHQPPPASQDGRSPLLIPQTRRDQLEERSLCYPQGLCCVETSVKRSEENSLSEACPGGLILSVPHEAVPGKAPTSSACSPFQQILTPIHSRMNAERRIATLVPIGPNFLRMRSA